MGGGGRRRRVLLGDVLAPGSCPRAGPAWSLRQTLAGRRASLRTARILMKTALFSACPPAVRAQQPRPGCMLSSGLVATKNSCPARGRRGRRERDSLPGPAERVCDWPRPGLQEAAGPWGHPHLQGPQSGAGTGWELGAVRGTLAGGMEAGRSTATKPRRSAGPQSLLPAPPPDLDRVHKMAAEPAAAGL